MADNDTRVPPEQPSPVPEMPPLPPPYMIPTQIIERWMKISPQAYVEAKLTRNDLDSLFFGLTKANQAQQAMQQCIIRWSNNDLDGANASMDQAKRHTIEADNHIRQFFTALMSSVTEP